MNGSRHRMVGALAASLALAAVLSSAFPAVAPAAPSASLGQRRAEAREVEGRLSAAREELMTALDEAEAVDEELQYARAEVASTTASIERLDFEIAARQAAFDERATAIYTGGGFEMLEALLSVDSLDDLFSRLDMLVYIQRSDTELLAGLRTARDQSAFLEEQQSRRQTEIMDLRHLADERRRRVDAIIATYEQLVAALDADIARLVSEQEAASWASGEVPDGFDPGLLVSDATFLAANAMSVADVQAFLDRQPGTLKSYVGADHDGATRSAAQMIHEAAQAWGVNPKVILVTLQKEQSLLSRRTPMRRAYDWAMGCGKMDSRTLTRYQGFGNQIWGGARALSRNRSYWRAGMTLSIDGSAVRPANASTHSLYRYTPHKHGNISFWRLYWKYFGDPAK